MENQLESLLSLFYGRTSKCLHFDIYFDKDELMSLLHVCRYFQNEKAYIYKLVIGKIPFLPFPEQKMLFAKQGHHYADELHSLILKIKSNYYLCKKDYLLKRCEKCLIHYVD